VGSLLLSNTRFSLLWSSHAVEISRSRKRKLILRVGLYREVVFYQRCFMCGRVHYGEVEGLVSIHVFYMWWNIWYTRYASGCKDTALHT